MTGNIMIIGGAGYIGSHAVKVIKEMGIRPVVFDNLSRGHRDAVLCNDFFEGDLRNIKDIRDFFSKYEIDGVMHFAALTYVGESMEDPETYYTNNVLGALNLLRVMRERGIDKLIFSSTAAVYGDPEDTPIVESHPRNPINPYGVTKYLFERAMEDYGRAYGLKYVSLRYFNAAGADPDGEIGERHNPETHIIPLVLMTAAGLRDEIVVFGDDYQTPDGTCIRDYIHILDLVSAHVLAYRWLEGGGENQVFNLGSEEGNSVKEVIDVCREVTGRDINVRVGDRRHGDPPVLVASSEKIRRELGWEAEFTKLKDIVETAWNFMMVRGMVK